MEREQSLGAQIAARRKEKGMTQAELAAQLGVTDKAVSKWERNCSCPDIHTLPALAAVLGVSVDALMQAESVAAPAQQKRTAAAPIFKAVPLALGVAVAVLSFLGELSANDGLAMLGIGLAMLALGALQAK